MRIGLSTAAYYGSLETEDAALRLAGFGLPCCEVFLETHSEYTGAFGALVKERLGNTQAVSVHAKSQHFEGDLIGLSKRQRDDAFRSLEGLLSAGEALGAHLYVYHGPARVRRSSVPNFARWQEGIGLATERACAHGIRLCFETVCWCYLTEPALVREFLRLWPEMGFVLDVKQVLEMGQSPVAFVEAMGERLMHVHILDFDDSGRAVLPGLGAHDFRELARALSANGYDGDIILEPYGTTAASDAALLESISWLRDRFGAQ